MSITKMDTYSPLVLAKLRKELILSDGFVFNTDYEGDPVGGAVKIPVSDTEVGVSNYNTASGISPETVSNTYKTITITNDVAVNTVIDGYEATTVPYNILAERLDSAGYSLAYKEDTIGGNALITQGKAKNVTSLTKDNIYNTLVDVRADMSKDNVPFDNKRYCLATPDTLSLILKSPEFISASDLGDEVKENGIVGRIAGFNVKEWNCSTANVAFVCGHPKYATKIRAWKQPIGVYDLNGSANYVGASAVKGRLVVEAAVLRDKGVRPVFSPTTIALTPTALTGEDTGKYKITCSATDSGTLKYVVLSSGDELPVYGLADTGYTSFISNSTKITASAGKIIVIGEFNSDSKLIAFGAYSVEA